MRRVWLIHSDQQTYITTFLKEGKPIGSGPAATAAAHPPDLDHFKGSGGGRNVIPLWKDQEATRPNITEGLLKTLSDVLGATVSPEQFFAYTYGVLAQPSYTERFWDQLEAPPPRIPITTDPDLFAAMAEHGQKLLHLHTYHERLRTQDTGQRPGAKLPRTGKPSTQRQPPTIPPTKSSTSPMGNSVPSPKKCGTTRYPATSCCNAGWSTAN